jgi:hypothetical protein
MGLYIYWNLGLNSLSKRCIVTRKSLLRPMNL